MGAITRLMNAVAGEEYLLARDLIALAYADGQVSEEEQRAIAEMCDIENVGQQQFVTALAQSDYNEMDLMPQDRRQKEDYLKMLIRVMGADGYSSLQEVYLLQIVASKMGLSQYDLMALVMRSSSHFPRGYASRIVNTFVQNSIDPRSKTAAANHEHIAQLLNSVAESVSAQASDADRPQALSAALAQTLDALQENAILEQAYARIGVDFRTMLRRECERVIERWR